MRFLILSTVNLMARLLCLCSRRQSPACTPARRVLLCNWAHLGDAVLMTAILPLVHKTWPGVFVGVLVGSGSAPLFQGHPQVDRVHCVDHWFLNRSGLSLRKRVLHYLRQRKKALREVQAVGYDRAIDFYFFFHNALFFLYQTGIPLRAAYTRAGRGSLLTHPLEWQDKEQGLIQYHLELLESVGAASEDVSQLRPVLVPSPVAFSLPPVYTVFQVGSGQESREWPAHKWKQLLSILEEKGHCVVFTGKGSRESSLIAQISTDSHRAINLCDQLALPSLIDVIRQAHLVVAVDSVAGHIASAYAIPTVSLFSGTVRVSHFRPHNPKGVVCTLPLPCSPCFRWKGCASMKCIRGLSVEEIVQAVESLL